jgi:F-type H+-transporting ATPase subunit b
MNRVAFTLVTFASSFALSAGALAGEEGAEAGEHAEHGAPHVANWWTLTGPENAHAPALGWLSLTFLVFAGGLAIALRKPLTNYLINRSDTVTKAIDEAKKAREAAEHRAREAEKKLAALDSEIGRMKKDFEEQGRAEAERLEKVAHDTAARIQKDAEDTINAERERATQALRAEAAKLALELAEERLRGAVTANDDARLQKTLVADLTKQ